MTADAFSLNRNAIAVIVSLYCKHRQLFQFVPQSVNLDTNYVIIVWCADQRPKPISATKTIIRGFQEGHNGRTWASSATHSESTIGRPGSKPDSVTHRCSCLMRPSMVNSQAWLAPCPWQWYSETWPRFELPIVSKHWSICRSAPRFVNRSCSSLAGGFNSGYTFCMYQSNGWQWSLSFNDSRSLISPNCTNWAGGYAL